MSELPAFHYNVPDLDDLKPGIVRVSAPLLKGALQVSVNGMDGRAQLIAAMPHATAQPEFQGKASDVPQSAIDTIRLRRRDDEPITIDYYDKWNKERNTVLGEPVEEIELYRINGLWTPDTKTQMVVIHPVGFEKFVLRFADSIGLKQMYKPGTKEGRWSQLRQGVGLASIATCSQLQPASTGQESQRS